MTPFRHRYQTHLRSGASKRPAERQRRAGCTCRPAATPGPIPGVGSTHSVTPPRIPHIILGASHVIPARPGLSDRIQYHEMS
eukprot:365813-Chlamydomonas_euryale.AAC.15